MRAQDLIPFEALEIEQPYDPWMEVAVDLEQAAQSLDLEPWIVERLRHCESELNCNLLLRRDDGAMQTCRALRVVHSSIFPNRFGELRISSNAYLNSTRAAAARTTWSAALFGLPFSGSATALICDSRDLSERELHRLVREFARSSASPSQNEKLLPGEGANEYVFGWLARNHNSGGAASVESNLDATSAGIAHAIRKVLHGRLTVNALRFALQGFGQGERKLAQELVAKGALLVAVVDSSGGVADAQGLNLSAIQAHVDAGKLLFEYPDADAICNADLLETSCDVLILAANERQVTGMNAERIKATLIVECVPDAVSPRAEEILRERNAAVLPYLLIHGAELAVVAYKQTTPGALSPIRERAASRLSVGLALGRMMKTAQIKQVSLRRAALLLAVERVAGLLRLQGCGL